MAASLIHEASALKFALNTGTVSEPKTSTVSMSRVSESASAEVLANVAQAVDALFDFDVTGHKVQKSYALNLA